jgi:hypothetical protein
MRVTLNVPVKLVSLANTHTHWRTRHSYTKHARDTTAKVIQYEGGGLRVLAGGDSYKISFVCHGTGITDRDNLASALKPIRDEVCKWLGVDDSELSGRVAFDPPEWGDQKKPSVDVRIEKLKG